MAFSQQHLFGPLAVLLMSSHCCSRFCLIAVTVRFRFLLLPLLIDTVMVVVIVVVIDIVITTPVVAFAALFITAFRCCCCPCCPNKLCPQFL